LAASGTTTGCYPGDRLDSIVRCSTRVARSVPIVMVKVPSPAPDIALFVGSRRVRSPVSSPVLSTTKLVISARVPTGRFGNDAGRRPRAVPLNYAVELADNLYMDLMLQFCAMALTSTMILRHALAERARLVAELAVARVEGGYAVRR